MSSSGPALAPARRPPSPRRHGPLGNLFALRRDVLAFLAEVAAECGDIAEFMVGPFRMALVHHPDLVREVLQVQHRSFGKGRPLALAKQVFGEGLLTAEGEQHRRQWRIVQPALHPQRVVTYGPAMTGCALAVSSAWQDGEVRDMLTEMTNISAGIAGKTMFDWELDSDVAVGIGQAMADVTALFTRVSLPFAETILRLPLPSNRRFRRGKAHLDRVIYDLIAERRREGRDHGDLLSMLLSAQDEEADGAWMTDTQVRDEAITLFLTGLDTTSLALTWTWYLLGDHPEVERRLHDELDAALGGRVPTIEDMPSLPYTTMVMSESMRLYPPGWTIAREALDDVDIGGYAIRKGTLLLMSQYLLQRDPRWYDEPLRFLPERWDPASGWKPPRYAYFPFGGGPRACIGQGYAMQEGTLVLATLAQRWRARLAPGHPVAMLPLINLRPRFGMRMVIERRG